jgi:hypothetical protein
MLKLSTRRSERNRRGEIRRVRVKPDEGQCHRILTGKYGFERVGQWNGLRGLEERKSKHGNTLFSPTLLEKKGRNPLKRTRECGR